MSASQDAVNPHHQNHDHYFKDVSNLKHIDVYRYLEMQTENENEK